MGGKARVSSYATWSLLALHVWPKFLRSCISIKTCVEKNPKSFLVKVKNMKNKISPLLSYNPNKKDLIRKLPKSF
jgi:hypothetical protein